MGRSRPCSSERLADPATEVMEQRVGARRQFQIPRMAQLEVEEQGPAEADAVEHLGEDIHAAIVVLRRVGHNTWTIYPYRLSYPPLTSYHGRRGVVRQTATQRTRSCRNA